MIARRRTSSTKWISFLALIVVGWIIVHGTTLLRPTGPAQAPTTIPRQPRPTTTVPPLTLAPAERTTETPTPSPTPTRCGEAIHPSTFFRRHVPREATGGEGAREPLDAADLREMGLRAVSRGHGWGPGYHCVTLEDIALRCIVGVGPMIILDPTRKGTEYGVRPHDLPAIARVATQGSVVMTPTAFPEGMRSVCPTLLSLPPPHDPSGIVRGPHGVDYVHGVGVGVCEGSVKNIPRKDFTPLPTSGTTTPRCRHHIPSDTTMATLTLLPGCVVTVAAGVVVRVTGALRLLGSLADPIVWTRENSEGNFEHWWDAVKARWRGIVVGEGAVLEMAFVIMSQSGGGAGRPPKTGSHRPEYPALTFLRGSRGALKSCLLTDGAGPALGIGDGADVEMHNTTVRGFQQGLECVDCGLHIRNCVFSHFPGLSGGYVDGDNDGLYLRGGTVDISDSVVAGAKDDCIDTATSKHTTPGAIKITRTLITHCLHEGIALSGSVDVPRRIEVSHSIVQYAQQGIEMGYGPHVLEAVVSNTTFRHNVIGVRYGDNYNIAEDGVLTLLGCRWADNDEDIVNYVRGKKGPGNVNALRVKDPIGLEPNAMRRCE